MATVNGERQQRATRAAQSVAARFGVAGGSAAVLHDSNHTIIHLAPAPVVAKVGTSPEETNLAGEVKVALYLASIGAPVVPPSSLLPPGPHLEDGLEVTFWEYCAHAAGEPTPDQLGRSLRLLHEALKDYPEPLPDWDRFDGVGRILDAPELLARLSPVDRAFLRRTFRELCDAIAEFHPPKQPLHGEPHGANLLLSSRGPRWIDFESACAGPQEWDLTVLPDEIVLAYFDDVNRDLLHVLRRMRSLCVAVWCWLDPDRASVLREAGTYHLALLKGGGVQI